MLGSITIDLALWLPIGVIGLWRWTAWLVKFILSSLYRTPLYNEDVQTWKVAVTIPVKNEPPESFKRLLDSVVREKLDQIRVVIYQDEYENIKLVQHYKEKYADKVDIAYALTDIVGKRPALAKAIAMVDLANADVVFTMDSDTSLGEGSKSAILSPFANPKVGGVTIAQRVLNPRTILHHLFDLRLYLRYSQDMPGQALGNRLSVLSGRCAAYLARPFVEELGPRLEHEHWRGIHKTGGGDDKWFTTLLHDLGYHTTLIDNAVVYTLPPKTWSQYISQSLRWSRNTWFSDWRALATRAWIWQSPLLLFYCVDRALSVFTVLIPLWLFVIALFGGQWRVIVLLLAWWILSRSIKIGLYLLDTRRFYMVLPYIFMNYVDNILKIHALFTIKDNRWMTRGESGVQAWRYVTLCLTSGFVILIGLVVLMVSYA